MPKRKLETEHERRSTLRPLKRLRQGGRIHLLHLSDELLLRTLSYLEIDSLLQCERVNRKLQGLSRDNEIWRENYYNQFVRHRARRLPIVQSMTAEEQEGYALRYSSRRARWLEHAHLLCPDAETNWKHAYKVKHNWTRGRARKNDIQVGSQPAPIVLAKVHRGYLFTVDAEHGVRVWKSGAVKASHLIDHGRSPTSMTIEHDAFQTRIAVGFMDGSASLFTSKDGTLSCTVNAHKATTHAISSIALAWPYVMTMSAAKSIGLFQYLKAASNAAFQLKSLANLNSDADLTPTSSSLRKTKTALVAGIAYAFNRFNAGWCLGLQEIRMDLQGTIRDNRTTSSVRMPIQDSFPATKQPKFTSRSASTSPFGLHPQLMKAPNSLSYCGCYLLAGLPDNTLMVYTVTSTEDRLEINIGRRLWGHTSAVSAAEVTSTGKALSISAKGAEMRYWELEELLSSYAPKKSSTLVQSLELLDDAINRRGDGSGLLSLHEIKQENDLVRRCVSFDDEQAIVVGERDHKQIISCFDFA